MNKELSGFNFTEFDNGSIAKFVESWSKLVLKPTTTPHKFDLQDCKDFVKFAELHGLPFKNIRKCAIVTMPHSNIIIKVFKGRRAAKTYIKSRKFYVKDITYNQRPNVEKIDCEVTLQLV